MFDLMISQLIHVTPKRHNHNTDANGFAVKHTTGAGKNPRLIVVGNKNVHKEVMVAGIDRAADLAHIERSYVAKLLKLGRNPTHSQVTLRYAKRSDLEKFPEFRYDPETMVFYEDVLEKEEQARKQQAKKTTCH